MFSETKVFCYIATEIRKKRKRVNSDLDSFCRFADGDSSAEPSVQNTKSVGTTGFFYFFLVFLGGREGLRRVL